MPRPPLYIARSDLGWNPYSPAAYADPKSGLVIHYDGSDQGLIHRDLDAFLDYWRDTRAFHTGPSRGWDDIGYSFGATPQGYIVEGRSLYRTQAAQRGGNTSHYSVTLGLGPGEDPTPEQINAVRQLREWLMEPDTSIAGDVLGHRDFNPTSCPGDRAYALVTDGVFAQPPGAPIDGTTTEVNDMLGLKVGDYGPRVKLLQLRTRRAGFGDVVGSIDSDYGPKTAEAVRQARAYVGSRAEEGWGDEMTAHAVDQVEAAVTKRTLEKVTSSGGASLPDTVTVSGELEVG